VEDDFITLLAEKWWVLGLSICRSFLSDTIEQATINHYCKQIEYCINLWGKECVAFGSDYHGLTHNDIITDIQQINTLERLYDAVVSKFWSDHAHKFFIWNAQRIIDQII
jgi:microsomal dipeptidase-like Zn-dependent dipeptidase